jgi:probable addiction module antidote protein
MSVSVEKKQLKYLRDNPEAIADLLNKSLEKNDIGPILMALRDILLAQNVMALARETGMRRDKLYGTFGGDVDPTLSRVLRLFWALNIRFVAVPGPLKPVPQRPKLGRPKKPRPKIKGEPGKARSPPEIN